MTRILWLVALAALAVPALCQDAMTFEAEDVSTPQDAWLKDTSSATRWNLWSTDKDAAKKWSGGKVLQSPPVLKDREKPEDGAPALHTVLTGIPKGTWVVTIVYGRDLGVSLDGKDWKRLSELGGRLGKFDIADGKLDFWVDDRFADKQSPGFAYYDCIKLTPSMPDTMGVVNGDFEFGQDLAHSGWEWWSRNGKGSAELVAQGHAGKRCAKLQHEGDRDWAFTNSGRLDVKPGQAWIASAWMKCQDTEGAELTIVGVSKGKVFSWNIGSDGVSGTTDWKRVHAETFIPGDCDQIYLRVVGDGKAVVWVDEVALKQGVAPAPPKPKVAVEGWAKTRVEEPLGRGMMALPVEGGKVYLGWRLLKTDPEKVAFNVYRGTGRGLPVKLTAEPLTKTTDFTDEKPPLDMDNAYWVRPVVDGREQTSSEQAFVGPNPEVKPYLSLKLQGDYTFGKVGIGDLDGDGKLDYVIKQPGASIDPYQTFWQPSPGTYKLEAYTGDGKFLWRKDLGWSIEQGVWYSPYLVYDFDGDGKAEVAVKTGEGDPRDPDGRVRSGPEYVSILDGMTGEEKARAEWPSRQGMGSGLDGYNLASRNQMGMAFLDGKTPCLLVARGTYTVMKLVAYQFHDGKLQELWRWDSREETGRYAGQGAHFMHSGDVDGDGRDEVVLGSSVIDDTGKALWTTGLGHPDRCFLGKLDPALPGLQVFYHLETAQPKNGVCMVDARTGQFIWGLQERTYHVGFGQASDIDPTHPGCECWASEDPKGDPAGQGYKSTGPPKWLFSAQGELLARNEKVPGTGGALYWDADSQRELVEGSRITKFRGPVLMRGIEGGDVLTADVLGDWREEIITSVKGELRIYTTAIPAGDRHVCLMQDPIYRHDVAHCAMGYTQPPALSYFLSHQGVAMWLSTSAPTIRPGEPVKVTVSLAAPVDKAAEGTVSLAGVEGLTSEPAAAPIKAVAGGTGEAAFTVSLRQAPPLLSGGKNYALTASLDGSDPTRTVASLRAEEEPLRDVPIVQAEDFTGQGGGQVQIRDDKVGSVGRAFSHWDAKGHWLSWKISVPQDGKYMLVLRYCCPGNVQREVEVDGGAAVVGTFPGTGGFGGTTSDWAYAALRGPDRKPLPLSLKAGEHVIKLTNADGLGMNMDYLALVPVG